MKAASGFLSVFLVLALILSCSGCASGTGTETGKVEAGQEETGGELSAGVDSTTDLFVPLTEKTSKSLVFPLTEEQAAQVEKAGLNSFASLNLIAAKSIVSFSLGYIFSSPWRGMKFPSAGLA